MSQDSLPFSKLGVERLENRLTPATFYVNNPFDVHKPGNDPLSGKPWRNLRECIDLANQTANVAGLEDNIDWDAAAFDANNDCVTILGSPLPIISEAVDFFGTVQGKNRPQVRSPGGFRVFDIIMPPPRGGQTVKFLNLVISGGNAIESVTPF